MLPLLPALILLILQGFPGGEELVARSGLTSASLSQVRCLAEISEVAPILEQLLVKRTAKGQTVLEQPEETAPVTPSYKALALSSGFASSMRVRDGPLV